MGAVENLKRYLKNPSIWLYFTVLGGISWFLMQDKDQLTSNPDALNQLNIILSAGLGSNILTNYFQRKEIKAIGKEDLEGIVKEEHKIKKETGILDEITDYIIERPASFSIIAGSALAAFLNYKTYSEESIPNEFQIPLHASVSIISAYLASTAYQMLERINDFKKPYLKNAKTALGIAMDTLFGKGDVQKRRGKELSIFTRATPSLYKTAANYLLEDGQYDNAMEFFKKSLEQQEKVNKNAHKLAFDEAFKTIYVNKFSENKLLAEIKNDPENYENYLNLQLSHLFSFRYEEAMKIGSTLELMHPDNLEIKIINALMYESANRDDLASEIWSEVIKKAMDEHMVISAGDSESEVYFLNDAKKKILNNLFFLKVSNRRENLLKSIQNDADLGDALRDQEGFGTARNIGIITGENGSYTSVTKFLDGTLLSSSGLEMKKKAAYFLGLAHKRLSKEGREAQDTMAKLQKELSDPLFKNIRPLLYVIKPILELLDGQLAVDLDAHQNNWIAGNDKRIYKIDNSERGLTPPQFDTARLIESRGKVSPPDREELLSEYLRGSQDGNMRGFLLKHYVSTMTKSLTKHIFCKKKEVIMKREFQNEERKEFLMNAREAIKLVRTDFSQVYAVRKTSFDELEKIVTYVI